MLTRVTPLVAFLALVAGCGQSPPPVAQAEGPKTPVLVEPDVEAPVPQPAPAVKPEQARAPADKPPADKPPSEFAFPDDLGGKKVAATLAPSLPPEPIAAPTAKPKARLSEIDLGQLPMPKVSVTVPTAPLPAAKLPRPSPPPERVPKDLGNAAALDPSKEKLPGARAADLPGIAAARAVFAIVPVPFNPAWFVRFGVSGPFHR